MSEPRQCRVCKATASGWSIPVTLSGPRLEDWYLCRTCGSLLERGFQKAEPDGALEALLDGRGLRFTETRLRDLIEVGLRADLDIPVIPLARREPGRRLLVRGELRRIADDLQEAEAASARGDWAGTLGAVRMIQGRAVIARRALEGMLGPNAATDLPPVVRAVQAVRQLITEREVESLASDELRARMHVVLQALDRELQAFLESPEEVPFAADRRRDALAAGPAGPGPQRP